MFNTPPTPYARGVIARPIGENVIQIEPETNGLDRVVDWTTLEEKLEADEYASRNDFFDDVRRQFARAGVQHHRHHNDEVVAGLFPEYRARLGHLRQQSTLTANEVIDIRTRHAAGERQARLAEEFGVAPRTISDIVNYNSWKDIAA